MTWKVSVKGNQELSYRRGQKLKFSGLCPSPVMEMIILADLRDYRRAGC